VTRAAADQNYSKAVNDLKAFGRENGLIKSTEWSNTSTNPMRASLHLHEKVKDKKQWSAEDKAKLAKEECKNNQQGKCRFGDKCFRKHTKNNNGGNNKKRGADKEDKSKRACHRCGVEGHFAKDCGAPAPLQRQQPQQPQQFQSPAPVPLPQFNMAQQGIDANFLSYMPGQQGHPQMWMMRLHQDQPEGSVHFHDGPISDGGATHTITKRADVFDAETVQANDFNISTGSGSMGGTHTGPTTWNFTNPSGDGTPFTSPHSLLAPDGQQDVISESQHDLQGCAINKYEQLCTYARNGEVIAVAHLKQGLYPFDTTDKECKLCASDEGKRKLELAKNVARYQHQLKQGEVRLLSSEVRRRESANGRVNLERNTPPQPRRSTPNLAPAQTSGSTQVQVQVSPFRAAAPRLFSKSAKLNLALWHARLGHIGFQKLCRVLGVPYESEYDKLCPACVIAKMTQINPSPTAGTISLKPDGPLRWINLDIFGPVEVETWGGKRWWVLIICMLTAYKWLMLMKTKGDVLEIFQDWVIKWENQLNTKVARVYSDGAKELTQNDLDNFYKSKGIQPCISPRFGSSWMNPVERSHRTTIERSQASRLFANMPRKFWGESALNEVDVSNDLPSRKLPFPQTPREALWNQAFPGAYQRHKPFGSEVYYLVSKINPERLGKGKLPVHAKRGVYLARDNVMRGVRVLTLPQQSLVTPSYLEVKFNETVFPFRRPAPLNNNVELTSLSPMNPADPLVEAPLTAADEPIPEQVNQTPRRREPSMIGLESIASNLHAINDDFLLDNIQINFLRVDMLEENARVGGQASVFASWSKPRPFPPSSPLFEPRHEGEAISCARKNEWIEEERGAISQLITSGALKMTPPQDVVKGAPILDIMFAYRNKGGGVLKARPTARGDQEKIFDDSDTHAPVTSYGVVRLVSAIACQNGWTLRCADATNAYLNVKAEKLVYLRQHRRHVVKGKEHWLYTMMANLYGRKIAGNLWKKFVSAIMTEGGFKASTAEPNLYYKAILNKNNELEETLATAWVDDFIYAASSNLAADKFEEFWCHRIKMKLLGPITKCLGMNVDYDQRRGTLKISQPDYEASMLEKYGMANCSARPTPAVSGDHAAAVGNKKTPFVHPQMQDLRAPTGTLLHLQRVSRPDIAQAVGALCQVASSKKEDEEKNGRTKCARIFKFIKGTIGRGISMRRTAGKGQLVGYVDASHDVRGTYGWIIFWAGFAIAWASRKAQHTTLSATESEMCAAVECVRQIVWWRRVLAQCGQPCDGPTKVMEDNQGLIDMLKSDVTSARMRHVDIRLNWLKDQIQLSEVVFEWVDTKRQVADVFTKPTAKDVFIPLTSIFME
jgi:hypothetical protein